MRAALGLKRAQEDGQTVLDAAKVYYSPVTRPPIIHFSPMVSCSKKYKILAG